MYNDCRQFVASIGKIKVGCLWQLCMIIVIYPHEAKNGVYYNVRNLVVKKK